MDGLSGPRRSDVYMKNQRQKNECQHLKERIKGVKEGRREIQVRSLYQEAHLCFWDLHTCGCNKL